MVEGKRQPWGHQLHFKDLAAGTLPAGEGQTERKGEDPQGTEGGGGCPLFVALPPWLTLPPGPPPFLQHLFNRNIKGPGPVATSLCVYLVPFIREGGLNPRPRGGSRAEENLSLTWSVASGIYSLNPGKAGVWGDPRS